MLAKLLLRQDKLIDRQDTLIEQVAALQENRSTVSQQIEELATRMSRVELSPSEDTPSANVVTSTGRPSDDVRVAQTASSTTTSDPSRSPERDAPLIDTVPATLQSLLSRMAPDDRSQMRALMGKYGADNSATKLDGRATSAHTATGPPNTNTHAPAPSAPVGNRSLVCKKEVLGEFDGDPGKLEHFLGRVLAITNSNKDQCWESAVVCALPQCFVGDAQVWHIGLSKAETDRLTTVDEWCKTMRRRFPVNKIEQRKEAHARKWETTTETAMTYYFKKVQLFRSAYGEVFSDEAIAQELIAALPASMRSLIRLPQASVTLEEVQDALCEWEPTWREDHEVPLDKKNVEARTESASSAPTPVQPTAALTSLPMRPPRSEQRPMVTAVKPSESAPELSPASSTFATMASLSATYDPTRIIPAADGQPRMYRRPDSTKIMRLARNCGKCSGQHFDFEHDHLLRAGQLRTLHSLTEDYPEVDEAELESQHF
ncbi:hypothetical protein A4X13_0g9162 [Tilletia indica]|uniref:Uncharacterized protein n=1 Tax=Tilletia indica TaxID=43049 RepID=A0A8T8SB65_9BASI|nr:hypothetical protein A4X13_0g9162 [Tilletia indica]